ncbi:diguanylate cyclase [Pseudoduganella sp. SL102]|uniref:ligand-binding sensor domain-containing diguanylate cyclase n=1 Tax=Pseudoduganella sp. SL102 TaxID=2995154 RepID=UPI00248AEED1|nr:ligand-binding sensor domain-containing diguanylate cyclase [Pseudoduganella sp. SL102]WBS02069.1 diguanylate cyclase [Pseudoduganella sp. SL102]
MRAHLFFLARPLRAAAMTAFTVLLVLASLPPAAALADTGAPPTLRFKKLGPLGNDEPSMLSLLQDRQGFMWIGTHVNGLYRYNGYQAVRYQNRAGDPKSLPHDRVSTLHEDRQGRIWAGTQNGLALFNPASNDFTVYVAPQGPKGASSANRGIIKQIISDGKDGMWLASWGGLQHFDPATGKFTVHQHDAQRPGSLASNDVNALARDAKGGLWVATWPGGLDYLPPGGSEFVHHHVDPAGQTDPRTNIVRALQFDGDGALWIGTESGVLRWDGKSDWSTRQHVPAPNSRVTSFYIDRTGTLWATTLSAGLLRWNVAAGTFTQYRHTPNDQYSLPGDSTRAMLQDRGGMLWVATFTDGIGLVNLNSTGFTRYVPQQFDPGAGGAGFATGIAPINTSNNAANTAVLTVARAPGGKLWLGGNVGISLFDPAANAVVRRHTSDPRQPGSLSQNIVYSLYQEADGPLWVGTSNGLNRLDNPAGPFKTIHFGNPASDYINAIAPGRGGILWLATGNSLIRYEPATGQHRMFQNDPADPASRAVNGTSSVLEDRAGRVWMGSEWNGGGLDLLDPKTGKFRHFTHRGGSPAGLADDNVSSLHEDSLGRIWIGTAKGLQQVVQSGENITFRSYAEATRGAKILSIRSDLDDQLWVSTIIGLFRVDPATAKSTLYTAADGMTDGFTVNSSTPGPDGILYFGGVHGLTAVSPREVRSQSVPPQLAITDIKVYNRSLAEPGPHAGVTLDGTVTTPRVLTLSSRAPAFSIEFAALHYTEPALNRYAYQLEGFDRDWIETDATRRAATYTNLDPGRYVFRVKAANHRGQWSPEPVTLAVTITPPFWETWWFRALAVLLVLALLWAVWHWRVRQLKGVNRLLEDLVRARTAALEESHLKLAAQATTDGLTGLSNPRDFGARLDAEWRRAARTGQVLSLALVNPDWLREYNHEYGHAAGDDVLRAVAGVLKRHGRRTTDFVARHSGGEFALLWAAGDGAAALKEAQAICAEVAALDIPHGKSPLGKLTVSIGVAAMQPTSEASAELVRRADEAVLRAKEQGRNGVVASGADA